MVPMSTKEKEICFTYKKVPLALSQCVEGLIQIHIFVSLMIKAEQEYIQDLVFHRDHRREIWMGKACSQGRATGYFHHQMQHEFFGEKIVFTTTFDVMIASAQKRSALVQNDIPGHSVLILCIGFNNCLCFLSSICSRDCVRGKKLVILFMV